MIEEVNSSSALIQTAIKFLREVMLVVPGEQVLTTIDTMGDLQLAKSFFEAALILQARPTTLLYETQKEPQMEPPSVVAGAIVKADVWIDLAVQYILYTNVRELATENGCRYACLSALDVDSFIRTVGEVNYFKMLEFGEMLVSLLNKAEEIQIKSLEGTNIYGKLSGNAFQAGGIATKKGALVMLGGQVGHLPSVDSMNGNIIVDGEIWPPSEIGILKEPVNLLIEKGVIRQVCGGDVAQKYENWLASFCDPNIYYLAHYVYGFNPGVPRLTGRIVEDERLFGSMTFGFGTSTIRKAASHTDCIVLKPSVLIDGIEILRDGVYVHSDLVKLCQEMRIPNY